MIAGHINPINLEQLHRPKTLIIVHYKDKRVSIPLFESVGNITEYLWLKLHKFEKDILGHQQRTQKIKNGAEQHINDIVAFTAYEHDQNKLDIKMNIILSFSRLPTDNPHSRTDIPLLDITTYYKYLELQPYYTTSKPTQLIPEYHLFSILNTGTYFTTYLARKITDGRFYSIKICRSNSETALNEYHIMKTIHRRQSKSPNKCKYHLLSTEQLSIIPTIDQIRKTQNFFIYIYQYCPGGVLRVRNAPKKIFNELQCRNYMKQLVWGIHILHTKFNIIHRALSCQYIEIDFYGNLRLGNYAHAQPCFSGNTNNLETYEQQYEIPNIVSPPEVQKTHRYNHLVDYFGIGVILQELVRDQTVPSQSPTKKKSYIQIAIENLMSENLTQRQLFCNQLITELHQQKTNHSPHKYPHFEHQQQQLTINKIYIGTTINTSQQPSNGIFHEQVLKLMKPSHDEQFYYLHPVNNRINGKSNKKSKDKSKDKNKDQRKSKINDKSSDTKNKTKTIQNTIKHNQLPTTKSPNKSLHKSNQKSFTRSIQSKNSSTPNHYFKNNYPKNKNIQPSTTSSATRLNKYTYINASPSETKLKLVPQPLPTKSPTLKSHDNIFGSKAINNNQYIFKF